MVKPQMLKQWQSADKLGTTFLAPDKPGAYRLFATINNGKGSIANTNIPFYVIEKP